MAQIIFEVIAGIIIIELCRLAVRNHVVMKRTVEFLKTGHIDNFTIREFPYLVINIPVYKETKNINELLNHFSKLKYPCNKYKINLVTTEKESKYNKNLTRDLVKHLLPKYNRKLGFKLFFQVHYPYKTGRKAHQLNYSVKKDAHLLNDKSYVGTFDADSRPHINTLLDLASHVQKDKYGPAYQQLSLYLKNYDNVGLFSKAVALFQTRWTLAYEFDTYLNYSRSFPRIFGDLQKRLAYLIGHGNFIRYDILKNAGYYPEDTPIEDLALGYRISYMGVKIMPLCYFDNCEVPNSILNFIKQNSTWYAGETDGLRSMWAVKQKIINKMGILPLAAAYLKRKYCQFRWAFGSLIVLIALILSIIYGQKVFTLLILLASLIYSFSGIYLIFTNQRLLRKHSTYFPEFKFSILICPFILIRALFNSVVLYHYLHILRPNKKSNFEYYKTQRD